MDVEERLFALQSELDKSKTKEERNFLGQFATPYRLASNIVAHLKKYFHKPAKFLEPSIGLGTFFAAVLENMDKVDRAVGYEIDPLACKMAEKLWGNRIKIICKDFLASEPPTELYNLIVANPPYSRHHHIDKGYKKWLKEYVYASTGINISSLAGLYCYFLILSCKWLEKGGVSCWLIPTEFMDVNYGEAIKNFLLKKVNLLEIHKFSAEDVLFSDAMVTSCVVIFKNEPSSGSVMFTTGGSLDKPDRRVEIEKTELSEKEKWTRLFDGSVVKENTAPKIGDFFTVKRGLVTGGNDFFIVNQDVVDKYHIPKSFLKNILPSPRFVNVDKVTREYFDKNRTYLFSSELPPEYIKCHYPSAARYIEYGEKKKVNEGYICKSRNVWYSCENRKSSVFLLTYMSRNTDAHPFRFIWNDSDALATNGYLQIQPLPMYASFFKNPKNVEKVWKFLNSLPSQIFEDYGRVYGGGLHKIEPKELLKIPLEGITDIIKIKRQSGDQLELDFR